MNVTLQLARSAHREQVLAYVRAYHAFEGIEHTTERAHCVAALLSDDSLGRIWLILVDGQPAGYVALCFGYSIEFGGRDAFVDELFVVPERRGVGAGRAALEQVQAEARRLGIRALHLEVARDNQRARRLYLAAGFEARTRYFLMSAPLGGAQGPEDAS